MPAQYTPLLSHREGILARWGTIGNDVNTVISIQAVSQVIRSLLLTRGDHLPEKGRDTIGTVWNYLNSKVLANIVTTGTRPGYCRHERSEFEGLDSSYNRYTSGKIFTAPSDVILFAKRQGHLATGAVPPPREIQIEITGPRKLETPQSDSVYHEPQQQDKHDWIEDICSKHGTPADLYTQLPSSLWFRLLVIEPGSPEDVMKCQLIPIELELAKSRYEALSYCWGNGTKLTIWWAETSKWQISKPERLFCNGSEVEISRNLGEALHHIRHSTLRRVIWADALCINQNSEEERSQQVSIMDSIYKNASRTLIWLGNSGNPEKGLHRICQIVNSWDAQQPANFSLFDPETGKTRFHKPTTALGNIPETKLIEALRNVFGYDWFHRRWVIQEVVLAKSADLLIGHYSISWTWIGLAAALLRTKYIPLIADSINSSTKVTRHAMNAYFMFRLSPGRQMPALDIELLALLRIASSFENSNPLDTIYALRGLAEHVNGIDLVQQLQVDYSMTEEQQLMHLTELLMRAEKAPLDFLSDAGTEPTMPDRQYRGRKSGPSWIPRWTQKPRSLLDLWAVDERFDASRGLPYQRMASRSPKSLAVEGIVVSTIMWRGDVLVFPFIEHGYLTKFRPTSRSILSLIRSGAFTCRGSASSDGLISSQALEIFARVLTAGRDSQARRDTSKRANLPSFAAFLVLLLLKEYGAEYDALSAMAGDDDPHIFLQIAETVTMNRTLFVTTQGQLGLGPVEMQAGDTICVFGGASMPFVLRKVLSGDSSDNLYNLIGECYIDGIMDGETVEAMKEGRNHSGPFVPRTLLEKLYEFPSLKQEGKEMMKTYLDDALQLGEQVHARLEVSTIELQ